MYVTRLCRVFTIQPLGPLGRSLSRIGHSILQVRARHDTMLEPANNWHINVLRFN